MNKAFVNKGLEVTAEDADALNYDRAMLPPSGETAAAAARLSLNSLFVWHKE